MQYILQGLSHVNHLKTQTEKLKDALANKFLSNVIYVQFFGEKSEDSNGVSLLVGYRAKFKNTCGCTKVQNLTRTLIVGKVSSVLYFNHRWRAISI